VKKEELRRRETSSRWQAIKGQFSDHSPVINYKKAYFQGLWSRAEGTVEETLEKNH